MDLWLLSIFGLFFISNIIYMFVMIGKKEIKPKKMLTTQLFLNMLMLFVYAAIFISVVVKL